MYKTINSSIEVTDLTMIEEEDWWSNDLIPISIPNITKRKLPPTIPQPIADDPYPSKRITRCTPELPEHNSLKFLAQAKKILEKVIPISKRRKHKKM